jgi:hypothetical protein
MDDGNGCTTIRMDLMPPNCTLTNGDDGRFYVMYILLQSIFFKRLKIKAMEIFWNGIVVAVIQGCERK